MSEANKERIKTALQTIKLKGMSLRVDVGYAVFVVMLETKFVVVDFVEALRIARELNKYERRVIRMRRKVDPWNSFKVNVLTWLVGGVVICGVVLAFGVSTETYYSEYKTRIYDAQTQTLQEIKTSPLDFIKY